ARVPRRDDGRRGPRDEPARGRRGGADVHGVTRRSGPDARSPRRASSGESRHCVSGRLLMVGLSHHAAPLDVRPRVAVTEANWRAHAPADLGTVLVSTCNRLEVYAWIEGRSQPAVRALHRSLAAAAGVPLAELKPL